MARDPGLNWALRSHGIRLNTQVSGQP